MYKQTRAERVSTASIDDDAQLLSLVYSAALGVSRSPVSIEDRGGKSAGAASRRSSNTTRGKRPIVATEPVVSLPVQGDDAERNIMTERAREVINKLPPEQRKALEMVFIDGLTRSEIAELTGDPLGTVKTRIRSGLLTLRRAFSDSSNFSASKADGSFTVSRVRGAAPAQFGGIEKGTSSQETLRARRLRHDDQICSLNMVDNLDKVLF